MAKSVRVMNRSGNVAAGRGTRRRPGNRRTLRQLEAVSKPVYKPFDSDVLRLVAFSDYRVQDISLLLEFIKGLRSKPNVILYGGDDVERFHSGGRNMFEELAALSTHGLCAVVGNDGPSSDDGSTMDVRTLRTYIRGTNVYNVHKTPLIVGNYAFIGNEGAPGEPDGLPLGVVIYEDQSIHRHLKLAAERVRGKTVILLSHCPPRGFLDRGIRFGRRSIGSTVVRKFLPHGNPALVVCGHVHSCGAQSVKHGKSVIVNAASHDDRGAPGRIALIELRDGKVRQVRWHILWELRSIAGIGDARALRLEAANIRTLSDFVKTPYEHARQTMNCGIAEVLAAQRRAAALIANDIVIDDAKRLPAARSRAYIDIETDLGSTTFIWLVSLHIEDEEHTYSFFADTPEQEKGILARLHELLEKRQGLTLLSYSNSKLEARFLSARFAYHGLPVTRVVDIQDIYYYLEACVAFPVQTTRLKEIARWCGFKPRHPDMDGFAAACIYGKGNLKKRTKRMLLEYNEDDVLSLRHVVRYVESRQNERNK